MPNVLKALFAFVAIWLLAVVFCVGGLVGASTAHKTIVVAKEPCEVFTSSTHNNLEGNGTYLSHTTYVGDCSSVPAVY